MPLARCRAVRLRRWRWCTRRKKMSRRCRRRAREPAPAKADRAARGGDDRSDRSHRRRRRRRDSGGRERRRPRLAGAVRLLVRGRGRECQGDCAAGGRVRRRRPPSRLRHRLLLLLWREARGLPPLRAARTHAAGALQGDLAAAVRGEAAVQDAARGAGDAQGRPGRHVAEARRRVSRVRKRRERSRHTLWFMARERKCARSGLSGVGHIGDQDI
mmetsp:Transcript_15851/g.52804  ORF Transcript_15851/g.52804 Transcript_15851/m.52804 type:complete len:215 (-) Transcript_15851:623-1267(-)